MRRLILLPVVMLLFPLSAAAQLLNKEECLSTARSLDRQKAEYNAANPFNIPQNTVTYQGLKRQSRDFGQRCIARFSCRAYIDTNTDPQSYLEAMNDVIQLCHR